MLLGDLDSKKTDEVLYLSLKYVCHRYRCRANFDNINFTINSKGDLFEVTDKRTGGNVLKSFNLNMFRLLRDVLTKTLSYETEDGISTEEFYNLSKKDDFTAFEKMLKSKKTEMEIWNERFEKSMDHYTGGRYCGSCQEAPCRCSDPEKTSTTIEF
ncbi:MAG: hypothetical protein COA57_07595 [Flavobacteriales bacterium]|nr:MAG: hypothetical protein COA57_07595 [Flavobacteriales bacterium]